MSESFPPRKTPPVQKPPPAGAPSNSPEFWRSIFGSLGEGVIAVDENGKSLLWNAAAARVLRAGSTDVPLSRWTETYGLYLPDTVTPYPPGDLPIARAMRGEVAAAAEVFVRNPLVPCGVWASMTATPWRDASGQVRGGVLVVRDITQAKRMEEALRKERDWASAAEGKLQQANETLRTLIEAAPLAIWAHDLEGNVKFWNPAAERIFGWSEREVLNQPLPIIPEDQREDFRNLLERYRRGEVLRGLERRRRKKDGSPIDISIWSAPLRDAAGNITAQLGIIADITERKELEEQFRRAQKMEAVGRLAGGVAHDFNNLLTIISGYGQMLLDALEPGDPHRENVAEILKAAQSAAALTNRLLAFSRRQIAQPRVLDLNAVVVSLDKMLHRMIGEDVELVTELSPNLGKIKADPGQIEQVLMNLVVNSRDAMPEGGRITIQTAPVVFDDRYARTHLGIRPGPYVMLTVSDTGRGMDAETMPHLFEPFFTTKEEGKGTGLGLSIVYGIVKQSGGDIWASSEPGKGTTFQICLPVVEEPAEPDAAPAAPNRPLEGTETILLAEDEASLRQLISEILRRQGYTVLQAVSGEEALRLCREQPGPIHLFLTDVVMPCMSGRALAERLLALRPALKVMYMSGYAGNAAVCREILESGALFLEKPFMPEVLIRRVREVLDAP